MTHIVDSNKKVPPCPKCGVVPTKHAKNDRILLCGCFGEYGAMTADVVSLQKYQLMCVDMLGRALRDLGIETVAQVRELKETREAAVEVIANWVDAIDRNGGGWDGWDQHYKNAKYGNTPIRALVDEALRRRAAEGEK